MSESSYVVPQRPSRSLLALGQPASAGGLLSFAAVLATLTILLSRASGAPDYRAFYESALSALRGLGWYNPRPGVLLNLNPPHVSMLVVPLTLFPYWWSLGLWQVVQVACVVDSCRRLRLRNWQLAAALCWVPLWLQQAQGQWAAVVAYLLVRDLEAVRRGAWLGLAVALKPFLGLLLLGGLMKRDWRALGRAASSAIVFVGAGIVLCGPGSYVEWWSAIRRIPGYSNTVNLSLAGALERNGIGNPWILPVVSLVVVLISLYFMRGRQSTWPILLPASILLAPLGWQYYAWLLLPLVPVASAVQWAGLAIIGLPQPLAPVGATGLVVVWIGSLLSEGQPAETGGRS